MALDLANGFRIRRAEGFDHAALCDVCLRTGDAGGDASAIEDDPSLIGMVYAVPYQVLEPEHCFVIEDEGGVCGYVMGTPDTAAFDRRQEAAWFPELRKRVALPDADPAQWKGSDWVRDKIHHFRSIFPGALRPFPAQGHIDFLPRARGQGHGKRAMQFLMSGLHAAGAHGIHLHVSPRNLRAQGFYTSLGFATLSDPAFPEHTTFMARPLP